MPNQSAVDDGFERQFFSYVLDRVVPANAQQDPNPFSILSDADFEWWWLTGSRTSNLLQVLMKETGTGRDFIGTTASPATAANFKGIFIDNWLGTAQAGAMFPIAVPYVMPASRNYTLLFTDSSGANNTVEIVFSGFKLWPKPTAQSSATTQ